MRKDKYPSGIFAIISGSMLATLLLTDNLSDGFAQIIGFIVCYLIASICVFGGIIMIIKNDE